MMLPRIAFLALLTVALAYGAAQEAPELEVLTASLPDAILNRPYRVKLEAAGGKGPYIWTVSVPALPKGLSLHPSKGEIAGRPEALDRFTFTVEVTDSSSPPQTAVRFLAIRVAQPLTLVTSLLPAAFAGSSYYVKLLARGGTFPLRWTLAGGTLPPGLELNSMTGVLSGRLRADGEFRFLVQVTDSGNPPQTQMRAFSSTVLAPLALDWKRMPHLEGGGIHGSVQVSNRTRDDCDLTVIVVAVNEYGKAFTLGYEHFPLQRESLSREILFGFSLPRGLYVVHADAVAEVPHKNAIYRARREHRFLQVE